MLVAAFCLACTLARAQTPVLDSLHNALKTAREDTNKVNLLCKIVDELSYDNLPASIPFALQAKNLAERIGNKSILGNTLYRLGNIYYRSGGTASAAEFCMKSLLLSQEIGDKALEAKSLNRMGTIYRRQREYTKAMKTLEDAKKIYTQLGDKRGIAATLVNLGDCAKNLHQDSVVLMYYQSALEMDKQVNDTADISFSLANVGGAYRQVGNFDKAKESLRESLRLAETVKSKSAIHNALNELSMLAEKQGQHKLAVTYAFRELQLAEQRGSKPNIAEACENLSANYAALKQFDSAYKYQKLLTELNDSLRNDDVTRKIAETEFKSDLEKKTSEIALLESIQQQQTLVRNALLGGLGLFGVLVFVLLFSNNQRKKANALLQSQAGEIQLANTQLQEKNTEITEAHTETQRLLTNVNDSIRYAKRIQDAMLPSTETLNRLLPEHFIFFRPKDVVSGDFYWCKEVQGKVFVAAVDCTGHGVPGAFMSLIGNYLLNDITQRLVEPRPDVILNDLHHELQRVLRQRETNNDDGMDICLCMIDLDTRIVEFAGAMNPLYAVVQGELREFKGTPEELGGREERNPVYERHILDLSDIPAGATMLYLSSDGYKDQYNAERQRFMPKRLRPLLLEIAGKPLEEQPRLLGKAIDAHRGDTPQVDDMLVLGVKL
jgi:serine phosphatase RsbU (regulator of sigma subunit)